VDKVLETSLLLKIGGLGILLMIIEKILKAAGKEEFAMITNIAGIATILIMVMGLISQLFNSVRTMFTI